MGEMLGPSEKPKSGVWFENVGGKEVLALRFDEKSPARVFLPKDPRNLGEVYRILEKRFSFETTPFRNKEIYVRERIEVILDDIRLGKIAEELTPINPVSGESV